MANKAGLHGEAQAVLLVNDTAHVNVTLYSGTVVPPPTPTSFADLSGVVYASECPTNPALGMPCMLSAVEGCTVMVAPAVLPLMETSISGANDQGYGLKDQLFAAVTDRNGRYYIKAIPMYGTQTSVAVMAQKSMQFGSTIAVLTGPTGNSADIFLETYDGIVDTSFIVYPDSGSTGSGDTVATDPYEVYYNRNAAEAVDKISAVNNQRVSVTGPAIGLSVSRSGLALRLSKTQKVSISVVALNGQKLAMVTQELQLAAGNHSISCNWSRFGNKPLIVRVKGESFVQSTLLNSIRSY
jgi:hypothetical protein